jgi:hypothetical protein
MPKIVLTLFTELDDGIEECDVDIVCDYIACPRCGGEGKHVNPSVDGHGLSREDFDEDPDFAENYFAGVYDVTCERCRGLRVVPQLPDPDAHGLTQEQRHAIHQHNEREREAAQERRRREQGIEY